MSDLSLPQISTLTNAMAMAPPAIVGCIAV